MAAQESAYPFHWRYGELEDKSFAVHGRSVLALSVIFSASLFFVLACIYLRWACRCRHGASSAASLSSTTALQLAGGGLDVQTIAGFPVTLHKCSQDEALCSICLGEFVDGEKVKVIPSCNHNFHPECVDQWLKTHASCPLCRAVLRRSPPPPVDPAEIV